LFPLTPWPSPRSSFVQPVTPPSVDPDEGGLISVSFNPAWLPVLLGAAQQLVQYTTWIGDEVAKQEAVDRATLLINMLGYPIASVPGAPSTPPIVTRYNTTTHVVETSVDGGSTWVPAPGSDPRTQTTLPPQTGVNAACNSAASEVAFLNRINDLSTYLGAGLEATSLAFGILGLLIEFTPTFGILFSVVTAAATGLASAGLTAINLALSSTNLDLLLCIIYCHLSADNQLDAARLQNVEDDVTTLIGGTDAVILNSMLTLQGYGNINNVMASHLDTDTCTGCSACSWCYTFDFTVSTQGWNTGPGVNNTTHVPGTGWVGGLVSSPNNLNDAEIYRDFSGINVTSVTGVYTKSAGSGASNVNTLRLYHPTATQVAQSTTNTLGTNQSKTVTYSGVVDRIIWDVNSGGSAATVQLKSITIHGTGTNPFGANNC